MMFSVFKPGLSAWMRGLFAIMVSHAGAQAQGGAIRVDRFRVDSPGSQGHAVEQASDLCYGKVAGRLGLWTVCDRNGGLSASRVYLIRPATLASARPGGTLVADEEFTIVAPTCGWAEFRKLHSMLGAAVLDHLQERVEAGTGSGEGPYLDLEAVTIGASATTPKGERLFVVAEEPYSVVLELALPETHEEGRPGQDSQRVVPTKAPIVAAYRYAESDEEQGEDRNDGLEGFAYAGVPGKFWWAEEGTRLHKPDAHPRLFFAAPRIGIAELAAGEFRVDEKASEAATRAVRELTDGDSQTLNGLWRLDNARLLAIDRNGGWVLAVDTGDLIAVRWFNIYRTTGLNLRDALAEYPGRRGMPYVSIEGIAMDAAGDLWLVDDPAMPEPFRASCLVRLSNLPPLSDGKSSSTRTSTQPAGQQR